MNYQDTRFAASANYPHMSSLDWNNYRSKPPYSGQGGLKGPAQAPHWSQSAQGYMPMMVPHTQTMYMETLTAPPTSTFPCTTVSYLPPAARAPFSGYAPLYELASHPLPPLPSLYHGPVNPWHRSTQEYPQAGRMHYSDKPAVAPQVSAEREVDTRSIAELIMAADGSDGWLRDMKTISDEAAALAPLPSVEESSVPCAVFAAEYAWELCQSMLTKAGLTLASPTPTSPASVTNHAFGAIGGERSSKKRLATTSASSKALDSPDPFVSGRKEDTQLVPLLTPPSSVESIPCPIPPQFQTKFRFPGEGVNTPPPMPWSELYWDHQDASHGSPRSQYSGHSSSAYNAQAAFVRFSETLLNATLLSPQALFLALYYMQSIANRDSAALLSKWSPRSLPYRLLIASLVLSNKVLDDNSYTTKTWASVSNVPFADISNAEIFVLEKLDYDLQVPTFQWLKFIGHMIDCRRKQRVFMDHKDQVASRLVQLVSAF